VYQRLDSQAGDLFAFAVFGESELESVATALHERHEPNHQLSLHH